MRRLYIIILLLLLTGCNSSSEYGYRANVVKVFDGDTIKLANGEKVRYIGIDTPEMNYEKGPPQYMAEQAREFNRRLVDGKIVKLEFDVQKRDKYNRLLAYIYVEDTFVNGRLLEEGYAKIFIMPPNVKYADELLRLQRKAREGKKGLWSD